MKRDQSSLEIVKIVVAIGRMKIFHKKEEKLVATAAAMTQTLINNISNIININNINNINNISFSFVSFYLDRIF